MIAQVVVSGLLTCQRHALTHVATSLCWLDTSDVLIQLAQKRGQEVTKKKQLTVDSVFGSNLTKGYA